MTDVSDKELEEFFASDSKSKKFRELVSNGHKIGRPKGKKDRSPRPKEKYRWTEDRKKRRLDGLSRGNPDMPTLQNDANTRLL